MSIVYYSLMLLKFHPTHLRCDGAGLLRQMLDIIFWLDSPLQELRGQRPQYGAGTIKRNYIRRTFTVHSPFRYANS